MTEPIVCRWCKLPSTNADRLQITTEGFPEHETCEDPFTGEEEINPYDASEHSLLSMIEIAAKDRNNKPQTVLDFYYGRYRVHVYRMDGGYEGVMRRVRVDFMEVPSPT
ncbi:hypothetical protein LCGC14_2839350, partial [marine sediment metagenome]